MMLFVCANDDARGLYQLHLGPGTFSFPRTSPIGVVIGEKAVFEGCEKRTCRQPTQRRGHGMRTERVEVTDFLHSSLCIFRAEIDPKTAW